MRQISSTSGIDCSVSHIFREMPVTSIPIRNRHPGIFRMPVSQMYISGCQSIAYTGIYPPGKMYLPPTFLRISSYPNTKNLLPFLGKGRRQILTAFEGTRQMFQMSDYSMVHVNEKRRAGIISRIFPAPFPMQIPTHGLRHALPYHKYHFIVACP